MPKSILKILLTNEQKQTMSDVYSLLNINQGMLQDFRLLADRVADHQTEKVVNKNMSRLKQIEERMLVDKGLEVTQQSIDEVISKVINMAPSGDTSLDNWTLRELRIVSYYLMKLRDDSINYMYALELLDNNWNNIFFNGLVFYLLNSWHNIETDYRTLTSQLLMKKLGDYSDSNRRYNLWKNRLNLFDDNGPIRMAAMLSSKKMSIKEAPTLLGFKEASIKQSYYSDVIIIYIKNSGITDRNSVETIFELHNLDRTKKLIFAYLVEKEDKIGDGLRRAQLCRFANSQLGEVTLPTSWAPFTGATENEVQKLRKAMQLVNMWFTPKIIESFFEICVQDKERKNFWLKYVDKIGAFKIIGSTTTKRLLQSNSKIGNMFLSHYIETSSFSSQTSALVLFIKNKMIVEFSDTGALYVYNETHQKVKTVANARKGIISTNDLKIPSMNGLVEKNYWGVYSIYNEEGRMAHIGYWQKRLDSWMNQIVLSKQNTNVSFMEHKHDDIFKPKPLPSENYNPNIANKNEPDCIVTNKTDVDNNGIEHYEININYNISSIELNNGVCVVANQKGFYLKLSNNKFAIIQEYNYEGVHNGSILIKSFFVLGWNEILYNVNGKKRSIGFIKITLHEVLFKKTWGEHGVISFNLY